MVNIQYYLFVVSIIDNPVITCDEIIEKTKTVPINLMKNVQPVN